MRTDISITRLQELLTYNPQTGLFTWLQRGKGRPLGEFAGTPTYRHVLDRYGTVESAEGGQVVEDVDPISGRTYTAPRLDVVPLPDLHIPLGYVLRIEGRPYPAHTLAHALQTGTWSRVSHLNGDKFDNRWSNLTTDRDMSRKFQVSQQRQVDLVEQRRLEAQVNETIRQKEMVELIQNHYKYNPSLGLFMRIHDTYENWTRGTPVKGNNSRSLSFRDIDTSKTRSCPAHIAAFILQTGSYPTGKVHHHNHDKNDNRWENLYVK